MEVDAAAAPKAVVFLLEKGDEDPENPPKPDEENGLGALDVDPKADEPDPDADEDLANGEADEVNAPNVA